LLASVINGERYSFDLITGLVTILPLPVRSTLNINHYHGSNTLIMMVVFFYLLCKFQELKDNLDSLKDKLSEQEQGIPQV